MKTVKGLEAELKTVKHDRDIWKERFEDIRKQKTDLMFQLFDAQERGRAVNIEPVLHENAQLRSKLTAVVNLSRMAWEQDTQEMRLILKSIHDKVTR